MIKLLEKKQLKIIDIFNEDATMNSFGLHYQGKTVLSYVRKSKKKLETDFGKSRVYLNKVGTSEELKQ
jgi:valyl-tRNA synthetase